MLPTCQSCQWNIRDMRKEQRKKRQRLKSGYLVTCTQLGPIKYIIRALETAGSLSTATMGAVYPLFLCCADLDLDSAIHYNPANPGRVVQLLDDYVVHPYGPEERAAGPAYQERTGQSTGFLRLQINQSVLAKCSPKSKVTTSNFESPTSLFLSLSQFSYPYIRPGDNLIHCCHPILIAPDGLAVLTIIVLGCHPPGVSQEQVCCVRVSWRLGAKVQGSSVLTL